MRCQKVHSAPPGKEHKSGNQDSDHRNDDNQDDDSGNVTASVGNVAAIRGYH
jgi:hypothetical protein